MLYYEERIIDGKLCWRGFPKGEWVEFTTKELTAKLEEKKEGVVYEKAPWWANPDIPPPVITSIC